MQTIWKYDLQVTDVNLVTTPVGAIPLYAAVQRSAPSSWEGLLDEAPVVWFYIPDIDAPRTEVHRILTFGTGHVIQEKWNTIRSLGHYQLAGGAFIGHVFHAGIE